MNIYKYKFIECLYIYIYIYIYTYKYINTFTYTYLGSESGGVVSWPWEGVVCRVRLVHEEGGEQLGSRPGLSFPLRVVVSKGRHTPQGVSVIHRN